MDKEDVVRIFKRACETNANYMRRELAIKTQFNRSSWEVHDDVGIIRITRYDMARLPMIQFFPTLQFAYRSNIDVKKNGLLEYGITVGEYLELEKLYQGDFTPDREYLKRLGAIS